MSWRSAERLAAPACGALCESLWLGGFAGAIAPSALGRWVLVALALVAGGLAVERIENRRARLVAGLAITIGLPVAIVAASRPASIDQALAEALVAVASAALAVRLGVAIGSPTPESALRRAVRCFLSVAAVVAIAAAAGRHLSGAELLVVVAVLAGTGHVAFARVVEAAGATGASRRPLLAWLAGVLAVALLLLLVAAGGALLLTAPLHDPVAAAAHGLRDVAAAAGYAVGMVGYVVLRAAAAIGSLVDVHVATRQPPHLRTFSPTPQPKAHAPSAPGVTVDLGLVLLLGLALVAAVLVVRLAVRRRRPAMEQGAVEEREALLSTRDALGQTAGRLRAAVARAMTRVRRPTSPAKAVRAEYLRLESRLRRRGHQRAPSASARAFLSGLRPDDPDGLASALADRYESARYADRQLSWDEAAAFRRDAERWLRADVSRQPPG